LRCGQRDWGRAVFGFGQVDRVFVEERVQRFDGGGLVSGKHESVPIIDAHIQQTKFAHFVEFVATANTKTVHARDVGTSVKHFVSQIATLTLLSYKSH
jgi:hypothetical protein